MNSFQVLLTRHLEQSFAVTLNVITVEQVLCVPRHDCTQTALAFYAARRHRRGKQFRIENRGTARMVAQLPKGGGAKVG